MTSSHPLTDADARENIMRLWQLVDCRYRKFRDSHAKRAMTGRAMLHEITFPLEAYAGQGAKTRPISDIWSG
jgi:hypothetical protein